MKMNLMKTIMVLALLAVVPIESKGFIGPDGQSNVTDQSGAFKTRELADIKVINVTGSTASLGSIMCVSTVEDDGYRASECSVEGGRALCVLTESCADAARCSCRQHGYVSQVNWVDSSDASEDATAGRCLAVSGDDNGAASGLAGDTVPDAGADRECLGIFLDSDTADDAAIEAYIDVR